MGTMHLPTQSTAFLSVGDTEYELQNLLERRQLGQLDEARLKLMAEYGNLAARKILNMETEPVLNFVPALGTCQGNCYRVSLSRSEDIVYLQKYYDYDDPAMCEVDRGYECATISRSDFEKLLFLAILNSEANGNVPAQYSLDGERRADHWIEPPGAKVEFTDPNYRVTVSRMSNVSIRISVTLNPKITFEWYWSEA